VKQEELLALYPVFADIPAARFSSFAESVSPTLVPAGTVLFDEHAPCTGFPLILAGRIRVSKQAPSTEGKTAGRELPLYRIEPGEICLLSMGCILSGTEFTARGVAESQISMVMLSPPLFDEFTQFEPFRRFVFGQFSARLHELMVLVEAVAFQRLDQRLANALLGRGRMLHVTHQQLADELGTIREMVTRLLGRFEERGVVSLSREKIEILDAARVRDIAERGM